MKRLFLLLPVVLMLFMTGCLKDDMDQKTIVLLGTEEAVKPIEEMGMDTLLRFIDDSTNLILPQGKFPPDIQGEYMFVPRKVKVNDLLNSQELDTIYFRFGGMLSVDSTGQTVDTFYLNGQHNRLVSCDICKNSTPLAEVSNAFVMGEGNAFTAYFTATYPVGPSGTQTGTQTRGYVITGKVSKTGIEEAVVAYFHWFDGNYPTGTGGMDDIYIYVYYEGTAVRHQWYQN